QGCGAPPPRIAVINSDDEAGRRLIAISRAASSEVLAYGLDSGDFRAEAVQLSPDGSRFQFRTPAETMPVESQLVGRVTVYNFLASMAAAYARGVSLNTVVAAAARSHSAPGRFHRVDCGTPFPVFVDYAHTADAL